MRERRAFARSRASPAGGGRRDDWRQQSGPYAGDRLGLPRPAARGQPPLCCRDGRHWQVAEKSPHQSRGRFLALSSLLISHNATASLPFRTEAEVPRSAGCALARLLRASSPNKIRRRIRERLNSDSLLDHCANKPASAPSKRHQNLGGEGDGEGAGEGAFGKQPSGAAIGGTAGNGGVSVIPISSG